MGRQKSTFPQVHIRVSSDLLVKIDEAAEKNNLSRSEVISLLCEYALENKTLSVAPHQILK